MKPLVLPLRKMIAVTLSVMLLLAAVNLAESCPVKTLKRFKEWCDCKLWSTGEKPESKEIVEFCGNCGVSEDPFKSTLLIVDPDGVFEGSMFATAIGKRLALMKIPNEFRWFEDVQHYTHYKVFISNGNQFSITGEKEHCLIEKVRAIQLDLKSGQAKSDTEKVTLGLVVLSAGIPDSMETACFPKSWLMQPVVGMQFKILTSTLTYDEKKSTTYHKIPAVVRIFERTSTVRGGENTEILKLHYNVLSVGVGGNVLHKNDNRNFVVGLLYKYRKTVHEPFEFRVIRVDTPNIIRLVEDAAKEVVQEWVEEYE